MRLVVLGGSGASTPELVDALAAWPGGPGRRPPTEVVLVGRSVDKLELVAAECRRRAADLTGTLSIGTETDRRRAIERADVVLNQVRIGGLAARRFDESFPRELGLPGEETVGPGGFANALRTVPALRETWADVAEVAPTALVVNLTNPAGIVVAAMRRESELRIASVCDTPISLTDGIAARLDRPVGRVRARFVGLNHIGWYVPEAADELARLADLAVGQDADEVLAGGAIGGPYLRYYLHPDRLLAGQLRSTTRAEALQALEGELLADYAAGRADVPRRGAGWYRLAVVPLIDGWLNGTTDPLILGLAGPDDRAEAPGGADRAGRALDRTRAPQVTVELPVDITTPGTLRPRRPVELPPGPAELLAAQAEYERLTVEAILAGSPRTALVAALAANPIVRDVRLAGRLVDAILAGSSGGGAQA